jgi:DNA replication protein DnaC
MNRLDFTTAVPDTAVGAWERDEAPACAHCGDSGIIGFTYADSTRQTITYLKCTCAATTRRTRRSGNLDACTDKTFATFVPLPSVAAHARRCADYAANPSGWLVLSSEQFGTGKSHLAAAIANAVNERGADVYFHTVPDMLEDLKATYDKGQDETFHQRFERIRNVDLLVLDDFGTEKPSPFNDEKIFQIINHRYNRALATVVTTNKFDQIDGRLRSRLIDVALVERLRFDHVVDYRSLNADQRRGKAV